MEVDLKMNETIVRKNYGMPLEIIRQIRQWRGLNKDDTSQDDEILSLSGSDIVREYLAGDSIFEYEPFVVALIKCGYGIDLDEPPFTEPIKREITTEWSRKPIQIKDRAPGYVPGEVAEFMGDEEWWVK